MSIPFTANNKEQQLTILNTSSSKARTKIKHGEVEPNIQGWISERYLKRKPRATLIYEADAQNIQLVTLFTFEKTPDNKLYLGKIINKAHTTICWKQGALNINILFNKELIPTLSNNQCIRKKRL